METDDRILELFKKNQDAYHSGEDISGSLGISRQALWKHIEKLKGVGYMIEAVPHLGYKLLKTPDKMLATEIKWNLKTKIIGKAVHFYESVGSTNNTAQALAEKGAPEGTIVIADRQTKGKGRLGRRWFSPAESGIYFSCILRPEILPNEVPKITLVAAVSAVKAIREFSGSKAFIKWPNDIIISDRKAGGILTELNAETDRVNFLIMGIGINVNTPKKTLPEGGTSIKAESKSSEDFSRLPLIKILLSFLDKEYAVFKKDGFSPVRNEFKSYSCTLGRDVKIRTSNKRKIFGKAIDVNKNGALVVKLSNGTKEVFLSGDVTLVR